MHIAALVLSLALASGMLASGTLKIARAPRVVHLMDEVGVTPPLLAVLGTLQLASTASLVAGIWFPPLAIAAAIGLVLYFAGAIVAHLRAHAGQLGPAVLLLVFAAATLVSLLASA